MENQKTIILEKGSPIFNKAKWVLRAMSTDQTRSFLCGVLINDKGVWVSSDGKRMHIWKNGPCYGSTKFFKAIVATKIISLIQEDNNFPDWEKLIPNYTNKISNYFGFSIKDLGFSTEIFKLFEVTKACFDLNFLIDLKEYDWVVYGENPEKSFHFKSDDLEVLIMPVNIKKYGE